MEKDYFLIKKEDLKAFEEYLYERENARATIEKYMTDMHTFFRYLDGYRQIDKSCLLRYKEWLLGRYAVNRFYEIKEGKNPEASFSQRRERTDTERIFPVDRDGAEVRKNTVSPLYGNDCVYRSTGQRTALFYCREY